MILIDYSGMIISTITVLYDKNFSLDLVRHSALSSIRLIKNKFGREYGDLVFACDDTNNWRKKLYPYYKANRKKDRDSSMMDWNQIFEYINTVKLELKETFPYYVLQVPTAEADDIISALCQRKPSNEKVLIYSADGDFVQLQRYTNVHQYSPRTKKMLKTSDPLITLYDHILSGDKGDGVPNILSEDSVFVDNKRQKTLRTARKNAMINDLVKGILPFDGELRRNFERNRSVIDLSMVPESIVNEAWDQFSSYKKLDRSRLMNYFIMNNLMNHMSNLQEF